jgi:hypothetical protein
MNEETTESLNHFRTEVLKFLAANIVVKEHRERY